MHCMYIYIYISVCFTPTISSQCCCLIPIGLCHATSTLETGDFDSRCAAVRHQFGRKQWWLCSHQSGTAGHPTCALHEGYLKKPALWKRQLVFFWMGKHIACYSSLKFGHSEEDLVDLVLQFGCQIVQILQFGVQIWYMLLKVKQLWSTCCCQIIGFTPWQQRRKTI